MENNGLDVMKNVLFLSFAMLTPRLAEAQYKPVDKGSTIAFTIRNFGFAVDGSLSGLQGDIGFDPAHPEAARFDISVDAGTVNTDNSLRDSHLRNDGYFDVKNYPRIRLVSAAIKTTGKKSVYRFTGELTIKGVTKAVSFPFTADPAGEGFVFSGSFNIKRKDFGVGGTSTISDELTVSLKVLAMPRDISSKALQGIMTDDFEDGLGVGCGFCHASAKGGHGLDFASDAKPEKSIARAMMRMTIGLNKKNFKVRKPMIGSAVLTITCSTCHKGEPFPDGDTLH